MNGKFAIHACLLGGMLLTGAATKANADVWNKKTYINTSRSIEVPGAVLPPGWHSPHPLRLQQCAPRVPTSLESSCGSFGQNQQPGLNP